jgi:hypothetical protein
LFANSQTSFVRDYFFLSSLMAPSCCSFLCHFKHRGVLSNAVAMLPPAAAPGALQLVIAVYGSDKKYLQNFKPFIDYCEQITSAPHCAARVRSPVYRVVVQAPSIAEASSHARAEYAVEVQPLLLTTVGIDVLFLKMSTEPTEARDVLRRWIGEVQSKQQASGRRPMVLVDALDASESVKSRVSLCASLGNDAFLRRCGLVVPLSFAVHRSDSGTAAMEHLCGEPIAGEDGVLRPFVVKSDASNGPKYTHGMYVMGGVVLPASIATDDQVSLHPQPGDWAHVASTSLMECPSTESLLIQEVVPTAAVVYKVYVLGPQYVFVKRLNNGTFLNAAADVCAQGGGDSIKELERVWVFNSQDRTLFPPGTDGGDAVWEQHISPENASGAAPVETTDAASEDTRRNDVMRLLASVVPYLQQRAVLGFGLFGMDLVALPLQHKPMLSAGDAISDLPQPQPSFALLDINYFPSFKGVPHAQEKLLQYIEGCVRRAMLAPV